VRFDFSFVEVNSAPSDECGQGLPDTLRYLRRPLQPVVCASVWTKVTEPTHHRCVLLRLPCKHVKTPMWFDVVDRGLRGFEIGDQVG
jgi:hypothetical protein